MFSKNMMLSTHSQGKDLCLGPFLQHTPQIKTEKSRPTQLLEDESQFCLDQTTAIVFMSVYKIAFLKQHYYTKTFRLIFKSALVLSSFKKRAKLN
jgi:hypothetical protein